MAITVAAAVALAGLIEVGVWAASRNQATGRAPHKQSAPLPAAASTPSTVNGGGPRLILPGLEQLGDMAGDAPNGSTTDHGVSNRTDVSGVVVCAVGTRTPIRVIDVTLRGAIGLAVGGFATRPLPLPGDKEVVEGVASLSQLGFSPVGPQLVQPCRSGWQTNYSSLSGSELAFAVGLAATGHGTATGINARYEVDGHTGVLAVDYPISVWR